MTPRIKAGRTHISHSPLDPCRHSMGYVTICCFVYLMLLGHVQVHCDPSEYFTRTTHDLSAWHNLHPTFHGELSLLSCAMTCGMDRSCLGIGHSMSPNQQCVLFIFNQAGEAGNHSSHHNLTYYLRDDVGKYLIYVRKFHE